MSRSLIDSARKTLSDIEASGTFKRERLIYSPQSAIIRTRDTGGHEQEVLNLCANNYLGLADNPRLIETAKAALDSHGFGMASVRFICGTQDLHRRLEERTAAFLRTEDAIVFPSCFDANGGVFEALLGKEDAVISDSLNHASIIDGIRLSKAQRFRYANNDMADLEQQLIEAKDCRHRLIVTDGVFSMDGIIADLPAICDLAEKHDALVMVDDCHATGFMGERGAGTAEMLGVEGRVHILTGTYGKALGGASGGYVAAASPIVDLLRQKARPYLFSNAVAPAICAAAIEAISIAEQATDARRRLHDNAGRFRAGMSAAGFTLIEGQHPIVPVMVGDAAKAAQLADTMLRHGVYVIAFSYPVVPEGKARIRTQMSAAHTPEQVGRAVAAFTQAGMEHGIIG
ncbi:glycine C-acetyltransferase [Hoeflea prorocentri]|uniref:2-amino-3-ketobutyrate coenzyme A ligase n=1 Tax=Hoeflea prorocentri TaxID=1922333 RepID=A0A9X3UHQ2_9HYPH|nr:glycine C-acetyltransferase [Hoeflea prorocentri]MCY6381053.1 glycine C-acetyltransferase [Hoeflea prorocentri]MDA5398853.1 glycine C-acetyltransferase [Hoeflea prorocentri]